MMPALDGVATDGIVTELSELFSHQLTVRDDTRQWWNPLLKKSDVRLRMEVEFGGELLCKIADQSEASEMPGFEKRTPNLNIISTKTPQSQLHRQFCACAAYIAKMASVSTTSR